MAEELARRICEGVESESAGIEPGELNPLAVAVLLEDGIDIRDKETRDVFEVYKSGRLYSHVITVCDEASAERCPIFPGVTKRIHWSFQDPSKFEGTWEEKLEQTRKVRDEIRDKVLEFCEANCEIAV
jgi:arsenate reductase